MTPPGRVLQLLGPSAGGMRAHVGALAAALRARGWEVAVAGPDESVADIAVAVPGPGHAWRLVAARRQLAAAIAGARADLVHAHGTRAGWLAALARPAARVPVVVTAHNVVLPETAGLAAPLLRRVEAGLASRVDGLIATSPAVAARFGADARVVPPLGPVPVARRPPAVVRAALGVDGRPLVVAAARLHPQKGLATLVEAGPALVARVPDVAVALVGEGPQRAALRRRIDGLGLGGTVRLAGPSTNAADELGAADVVAIPSVWDSGPLVAAEALALARPVVSTPVGFVPDLVVDGVSGRLVPVGDAGALAAALADTLLDRHRAMGWGAEGRRRAARLLDPDRLVEAIEDVYDEALTSARARGR